MGGASSETAFPRTICTEWKLSRVLGILWKFGGNC